MYKATGRTPLLSLTCQPDIRGHEAPHHHHFVPAGRQPLYAYVSEPDPCTNGWDPLYMLEPSLGRKPLYQPWVGAALVPTGGNPRWVEPTLVPTGWNLLWVEPTLGWNPLWVEPTLIPTGWNPL